jgi:hypothetical protein
MNSFKEWLKLQEVGTGTNAVAVFARPIGGGDLVRRTPLDMFGDEKKKKKKKHPLDNL